MLQLEREWTKKGHCAFITADVNNTDSRDDNNNIPHKCTLLPHSLDLSLVG